MSLRAQQITLRVWHLHLLLPWLLMVVAGCSSLPVIDAQPTTRPSQKTLRAMSAMPRVDGARGPLSARQAKAILDGLHSPENDFLDLHLAVEQTLPGSPLTAGNRLKLLHDGPSTYSAMLAAISAARHHINMETYIFEDDEIGQRFAQALIAKQREGVRVTLIHDSVGTLNTPTGFFTRLSEAGIKVLEYNPVNPLTATAGWNLNQRDHRKLLVVDGRIAFLGGINISSVYSGSSLKRASRVQAGKLPWRDTDIQLEGPVVTELQKLFLETWARQQGEPLNTDDWFVQQKMSGNEVVRAIGSSPADRYSFMYAALISAFRSAQSEIWVTNAYFVPDPQLVEALQQAVARGVDVRLILPSETDSWLVLQASRAHYSKLLKAGVKIYLRRNALLHVKTAVIDGVWSTVGSTNLDWRSFLHNQEVDVMVLGNDFGTQMRESFLQDAAQSDEITLKQWQHRPVTARFSELFGRIWQYWL